MKITISLLFLLNLFNSNVLAINKAIIILGQPGAGKGTQAQLLSEKLKWPVLAASNLKRELAQLPVATIYSQHIKADEQTREIFKIGLMMREIPRRSKGYVILENWPKTHASLEVLLLMMEKKDILVIELLIPDDRSIERVAARKQCAQCGMTYGLARQEQKDNLCDSCGAPIVFRVHDNKEDYLKRLPRFHARQLVYHEIFKQHGIKIYEISADGDPQEINEQILSLLENIS